jgi:hypothetical protein
MRTFAQIAESAFDFVLRREFETPAALTQAANDKAAAVERSIASSLMR